MSKYTTTNGIVERKQHHLLEVARSLLFQAILPLMLGINNPTAAYLVNLTPPPSLDGQSPFKLYLGRSFLVPLTIFGCLSYTYIYRKPKTSLVLGPRHMFFWISYRLKGLSGVWLHFWLIPFYTRCFPWEHFSLDYKRAIRFCITLI